MEAMFSRAQPRQIGINHQALVGVLRGDAADRFANAVGINALQAHLQGSAPARVSVSRPMSRTSWASSDASQNSVFLNSRPRLVPSAVKMVRRSADAW